MTMTKCKLCEKDDPDDIKEFKQLNLHLVGNRHQTTMYKYKKEFGIDVEPLDILMDKLQCNTGLQLSALLNVSRGGVLTTLRKDSPETSLKSAYKIIAVLLKRMPEEELKKSLREIRFLRDNE